MWFDIFISVMLLSLAVNTFLIFAVGCLVHKDIKDHTLALNEIANLNRTYYQS